MLTSAPVYNDLSTRERDRQTNRERQRQRQTDGQRVQKRVTETEGVSIYIVLYIHVQYNFLDHGDSRSVNSKHTILYNGNSATAVRKAHKPQ